MSACMQRCPPPAPRKTPPAVSATPAAHQPLAPPLWPEANQQNHPGHVLSSPPRLAAPSANLPPQDTGDCRIPVQENSHLAENTKLAVHPKTADKGAEPGFSSTSGVSSASNIGAAVGGDVAVESPGPYPVKESVPLPSQAISTSAEVERKWDGRQHRPVTVKNGCFGNVHRSEESVTSSALPTGTSSNQPEEDYYSSDSGLLVLGGPREDLAAERKVHVLRGDQKWGNPPAADSLQSRQDDPRKNLPAYEGSPEEQTQPFMDPSSRHAPANDAQLSFTQMGTKSLFPVTSPMRLPPSDLDGVSSVERKAPKPPREVSAAGGDTPSGGSKLPSTGALGGRPQRGMETRPSAVEDHKRDSRIFHSNCSENDMPSKPGLLSAELSSDGAGETGNVYSGSSERLRMSNSDSASVSTSNSDPILISESSLVTHPPMSTTWKRNRPSGAIDATLPPEVDAGEEDTSFRSHHVLVEENRSMDLMGVPPERASWRPSPDSTSNGQPENKAKDQPAGPSLLDEEAVSSHDNWMLFAGFVVALLASAAYVLYKKK
ncbi:PREDICTED: uncharacterized protein LOC106547811 isoform X1 [Thamnophis sirtalis]|uniref:Uncharacterized protein LOC106547811 isoform X1 n=1 Tax=Thamnophis sirtalis TaxID=35019 RepID=A0A6I9XWG9_9SAUR|nr:PREDICTED: uncharacterized protein LOC106547811 isoform X1 [Thamnophis sirtalis]